MIDCQGYTIEELLFQDKNTVLYRGKREADQLAVILKACHPNHSSLRNIASLSHEYEIMMTFNGNGVVQPIAFEEGETGTTLVLEDIGGELLQQSITLVDLSLEDFLWLAIEISGIISVFHQANIIHKDINPFRFIVNRQLKQVKLIDCAQASIMPHETAIPLRVWDRALAYISPEQTGRMNRPIDYRTDYYSMGVMFYELLTGQLPFIKSDPLELVHCHLARQPMTPFGVDEKIPKVLSDIIMKLLSKMPEDRYQSAWSLRADLEMCRERLQPGGQIEGFSLGKSNIPWRFQVSQKLYGRNAEMKTIFETYNRTRIGSDEILMLPASAGIGKTFLVQEFHKAVTRNKGFFVSCKFGEFQRSTSYSALFKAFKDPLREILAEKEFRVRHWKEKLLSALGSNAQLIIDVIPELEFIIGKQKPVKKTDPISSTNRFNRVFLKFIRALCEKDNPLVLFLDDLQWVDLSSLKLLESIMADEEGRYFFVIGAYRDDAVDATHPLMSTLNLIRETKGNRILNLILNPLELDDITHLIAKTLFCDSDSIKPLAELVLNKTDGNPLYIHQFLAALYDESLLSFDTKRKSWDYDSDKIQDFGIPSNMAELLMRKLKELLPEAQHLLRFSSCIGYCFDPGLLSQLTQIAVPEIRKMLIPAVEAGLVLPVADAQLSSLGDEADDVSNQMFEFQHSRVQQTVYETIDIQDRKEIHLKIGRLLKKTVRKGNLNDNVFDTVYNLNIASNLIDGPQERIDLARLNLIAGSQARKAAAIEPAYIYYRKGLELIGEDCWQADYDLALDLYTGAIEASGLGGHENKMETWFALVKKHARTLLDQIPVYRNVIQTYTSQNKLLQALETARTILHALGLPLPKKPTTDDARKAFEEVQEHLTDKNVDNLATLPEMTDPNMRGAMKILTSTAMAAYGANYPLALMLLCKEMDITMQYGSTAESAFSFCGYGAMVSKIGGNIESGYRISQMAFKVISRFNAKEIQSQVLHAFCLVVSHQKQLLRETLETSLTGYENGMESGDFENAGLNLYCHSMHLFFAGENLHTAAKKMAENENTIRKIKQPIALMFNDIFQQAVLNLLEPSEKPWILSGSAYQEHMTKPQHYIASTWLARIYTSLVKLMYCYLFEEYEQAIKITNLYENEIDSNLSYGAFSVSVFNFYDSLVRLSIYSSASTQQQKQILKKVAENQDKLKKWSKHAPMNYLNKFQLVEAERFRIQGQDMMAETHYDLAIKTAKEYKFIHEEAMANELAAKFWIDKTKQDVAIPYMQRAYHGYALWGARRKTSQLEKKYSHFFRGTLGAEGLLPSYSDQPTAWSKKEVENLDLSTMIKASHAISGEIQLDKLLTTLIQVVIENAGAQTGFLIMESQGKLLVEACGTIEKGGTVVQPAIPVEEGNIAISIIEHVALTREVVVLDDAFDDSSFAKDPHIQSQRSKSVLCSPILYKAKMIGLFYLENQLIAGVFTPERLKVLQVIAAQIAISIENAKLFTEVKEAEKKYRSIFENAVEGIFQMSNDGKLVDMNPAFAHILGYESREDLTRNIRNFERDLQVNPAQRKEFMRMIIEENVVSGFEVELYRKDRSRVWVSLHASPVFDKSGKISHIEGIVNDITEQHRIREELRISEKYLRTENIRLRSNIKDRYKFDNIIGKSSSMQKVYELILSASTAETNAIIYGESGTGKELVARAIHNNSKRQKKNFIPVNCGAIPENLFESEFFGYKKGAFTGADRDKNGFFDQADGGTLFLDELGEISPNIQVKLLRVIEGSGYVPVGASDVKKSDVRIIAATNKNLLSLVNEGLMREDFFYRIHIIPIRLPPLRERKEDIPLLIDYFMKEFGSGKNVSPLPVKGQEAMLHYHWPGNVRELQNTIHRYITLHKLDFIKTPTHSKREFEEIPEDMVDTGGMDYRSYMEEIEKQIILKALEQHQWHREKAALSLGLPRRTFFRKLAKLGLFQNN